MSSHSTNLAGAESAETSKARVLRVATELFAQHGFHGTAIQQVSDASGLGRGALYHHIKSKDQLLYEVLRTPHREIIEEADAILESAVSPEQKLREMTRAYLRNLVEKRAAWMITSRDLGALAEQHRAEITSLQRRHQAQWRGLFNLCEQAGLVRKVSDLHFRGFLGMLSQAFNWIDPGGRMSPNEIADAYLDLLLNGLKPR